MTARTLSIFAGLTFLGASLPVVGQPTRSEPVAMSIPAVVASTGSETTVPINLRTGGAALGALQFDLTYDPAVLEAVKVDPGRLLSGLTDFNITTPGRIRVALATSEGINGEGELLVASFRGVGEGQSSLRIENARAWEQATGFETTVIAQVGVVTVEAPRAFPVVPLVIGLVALGGLLLLAAIIAILLFRRKRKAAGQSYAPAVAGAPAWPPVPVAPGSSPPASAGQLRCGCGQTLFSGSQFCPSCGAALATASARCPSCGAQRNPGARFCGTCGQPVG